MRRYASALNHRAERYRCQVVGPNLGQNSPSATDGGPDRSRDESVAHWCRLTLNFLSETAKLPPGNDSGQVAEWLKAHAWRACIRLKRIEGSNPSLSAQTKG